MTRRSALIALLAPLWPYSKPWTPTPMFLRQLEEVRERRKHDPRCEEFCEDMIRHVRNRAERAEMNLVRAGKRFVRSFEEGLDRGSTEPV